MRKRAIVAVMLAIGFCFCLSACSPENKKYDLTEIEQEEFNHDLFIGFCVMPMEHTKNSFVAKRSYQEEGYFSPKAFKNSEYRSVKWRSNFRESSETVDGQVIYCYEYEMEIDPSKEKDEYYAVQLVYQGTDELIYLQQLGEVYPVSPGEEGILNGKIRIRTDNDVKAEYFIYEVRFHKLF